MLIDIVFYCIKYPILVYFGNEIFFQISRFIQNLLCKMLLSVFISYSKKEIAIIIIFERKFGINMQYVPATCSMFFCGCTFFYCISYNNEAGIEKT